MNLRYTLSFLRILKIPGLYPLMRDWQASIRINFIFSAYESGLLKALSQPCDRKSLVEKLQIKRPELFDALLEVGLATKELAVKNAKFFIKGKRSKAIVDANGDMLAAIIQASVTYYSDAYKNAAARMHGEALGDNLNEIGEIVARFAKMTEPIIKDFIASLVRGKNHMSILDVGCGSGFLLRSVYELNNNVNGIGLDIDEAVVGQAKNNIKTWGLADKFEIHHGNIFSFSEKTGPFDLISLINITLQVILRNLAGNLAKLNLKLGYKKDRFNPYIKDKKRSLRDVIWKEIFKEQEKSRSGRRKKRGFSVRH